MNYNGWKLIAATVIAVACIVALIVDMSNDSWAVPVLTLLVGYVVGNAQVTSQDGNVRPIAYQPPPPPPPAGPTPTTHSSVYPG